MPAPKKPSRSTGRDAGDPGRRARPGRGRLSGRKIVALGILIVLPLVVIAGALGSLGSKSNTTNGAAAGATSAPLGLDLMTQACSQLSTLAHDAGASTTTSGPTTGATSRAGTTSPGGASTATTGAASTTTSPGEAAAATNLLTQMHQVAQLAASAATASSAWQPMATDVGKLNDMLQSDTGDAGSFTNQMQTVAQECSAVTGATASTQPTG